LIKRLRRIARNLLSGTNLFIKYQIWNVERIFAYHKDFLINYAGGVVTIEFKSCTGYLPTWSYAPMFVWDSDKKAWHVRISDISFYTTSFPLFELVNELRGYLLLGDLRPGDTVIDAGTSSGISAMYFAKRIGPAGKLICLEPDPNAIEILSENIMINNLENVILLKKGISDRSGRESLLISNVGASRISEGFGEECKPVISIEAVTLDEVIRQYSLNKVDFVKMDIEGAEVKIVEDLTSLLATQPELIIAIASYHEYSGRKASSWIQDIGKEYKNIEIKTVYPHHETTFLLNKENVDMVRRLQAVNPYAG